MVRSNPTKQQAQMLAVNMMELIRQSLLDNNITEEFGLGFCISSNNKTKEYSATVNIIPTNLELDAFLSSIPIKFKCRHDEDMNFKVLPVINEIKSTLRQFSRTINLDYKKKQISMGAKEYLHLLMEEVEEIKDLIPGQKHIDMCNIMKRIYDL